MKREAIQNRVADKYQKDEAQAKMLIARIKCGDRHALDELVQCYYRRITALACEIVKDYDEAADIAQDVFIKMAHNIWRYDEKREFFTWIYRITVNASIDHIRKHRRHRHEQIDGFKDIVDTDYGPDLSFKLARIGSQIKQASLKLNDKQRTAFILCDVDGRSFGEAAVAMGMPNATVRWYLHRARSKIRKELVRRCPHLLSSFDFLKNFARK